MPITVLNATMLIIMSTEVSASMLVLMDLMLYLTIVVGTAITLVLPVIMLRDVCHALKHMKLVLAVYVCRFAALISTWLFMEFV